MAGRRETKKAQTRAAILAEAERLFIDQGYARATMESIAQASGIAVGTIYNYYPAKPDVIRAITDAHLAGLDDALQRARSKGKKKQQAPRVLVAAFSLMADHDRRIWREAWAVSVAGDGQAGDSLWARIESVLLNHLDAAFEDLGLADSIDPASASEIGAALLLRYVTLWIGGEDAADIQTDLKDDATVLAQHLRR